MLFAVNHGTLARNTYATQTVTSGRLEKSIEKLSSGLRINKAADDASGSAITEKLRRQVRGLSRAVQNAQDGVSTVQAADGAIGEVHDVLQRMRELAGQACNETLTSNDRLEIQNEITQLRNDINDISYNTEFNTKKLLDGSQAAQVRSTSSSFAGIANGGAVQGGQYDVSVELVKPGISQTQRSQTLTIAGTGDLVAGSTRLQSIAQLYDANGTFVLATPQTLSLHGNARSASITLDGMMTIDQLAAQIQNAIAGDSGLAVANSKVGLVTPTQSGVADRAGYIQFTSGAIGENGEVSFSGNQDIINALGFAVTRESQNNLLEVSSKDVYGNVVRRLTSDDTAVGLLDGADVQFSSQPAQVAGFGGLQTGLVMTGTFDSDFQIRVGGTGAYRTIHAHQGNWSMEGLARYINRQFDTFSLDGVQASVVDGDIRITYDPPLAGSTSTIDIIPRFPEQNAIGIPQGNFSGFVQCTKKAENTVYGFTRFATAAGTVRFSVSDGVNAATISYSLLTNIATPDLINVNTWKATQNDILKNAGVQVRIDAINDSLTFTSLRVGNETAEDGTSTASRVKIALNATALTHGVDKMFGLAAQTSAVGSGDKNATVAVSSRSSQFQIGSDEKQNLEFSIAELSARSLNVDNLDLSSIRGAQKSITRINKAIDKVSGERSRLGSLQTKLESAIKSLSSNRDDLRSVESRISDTDAALEMVEFTRTQVVSQAGSAMMVQANVMSLAVQQLLS